MHEYALMHGSPVPGCRRDERTGAAAARIMTMLGGILRDGSTAVADHLDVLLGHAVGPRAGHLV